MPPVNTDTDPADWVDVPERAMRFEGPAGSPAMEWYTRYDHDRTTGVKMPVNPKAPEWAVRTVIVERPGPAEEHNRPVDPGRDTIIEDKSL